MSGWGIDENNRDPLHLRQVEVTAREPEYVLTWEFDVEYGPSVTLEEAKEMVIAGAPPEMIRDGGYGDSGGPLTTLGASAVLVGVVSSGDGPLDGCGYYGAYAQIASFAAWIDAEVGLERTTSEYCEYPEE